MEGQATPVPGPPSRVLARPLTRGRVCGSDSCYVATQWSWSWRIVAGTALRLARAAQTRGGFQSIASRTQLTKPTTHVSVCLRLTTLLFPCEWLVILTGSARTTRPSRSRIRSIAGLYTQRFITRVPAGVEARLQKQAMGGSGRQWAIALCGGHTSLLSPRNGCTGCAVLAAVSFQVFYPRDLAEEMASVRAKAVREHGGEVGWVQPLQSVLGDACSRKGICKVRELVPLKEHPKSPARLEVQSLAYAWVRPPSAGSFAPHLPAGADRCGPSPQVPSTHTCLAADHDTGQAERWARGARCTSQRTHGASRLCMGTHACATTGAVRSDATHRRV